MHCFGGNIIADRYKTNKLHRLRVSFSDNRDPILILNDALICHHNPAGLFRCRLQVDDVTEEQQSSGVWISTASGASGAMKSAGGRPMNPHREGFQYKPRELHQGLSPKYHLTGSTLGTNSQIKITSMVRQGLLFADGAHHKAQLHYGDVVTIKLSKKPIRTIIL